MEELDKVPPGAVPVAFDPENLETYPSVCQSPEEVNRRFGFVGGETLVFDADTGQFVGWVRF